MRRNITALLLLSFTHLAAATSTADCAAVRPPASAADAVRPECGSAWRDAYPFAELLDDPAPGPALALAAVLLGGMALRARPR